MVVKDGQASTSVTFSEPGTYVIRAYADDGVVFEPADVTVTRERGWRLHRPPLWSAKLTPAARATGNNPSYHLHPVGQRSQGSTSVFLEYTSVLVAAAVVIRTVSVLLSALTDSCSVVPSRSSVRPLAPT